MLFLCHEFTCSKLVRLYINYMSVMQVSLILVQFSEGKVAPASSLADGYELEKTHILPDKADMFLAYATVPGYR